MKTKMIRYTLSLVMLLSTATIFSQPDSLKSIQSPDKKYILWVSPSKATHVYGFMFNAWPKDSLPYPEINGVEINVFPIGVFVPFLVAVYSLDVGKMMNSNADSLPLNASKDFKKVNGLQIGFVNLEPTIINGLDINASGSYESVTNGFTLSGVRNGHYVINGLTVAVIGNADHACNGLQVALVNSCKKLKGFQIGLWNKNQKRSLPFINWCFKTS